MARIISYNSHDFLPVEVVPVIASFDSSGQIRPLYVRVTGEACKVSSYRVLKNYKHRIQFCCELCVRGRILPMLITYYPDESIWAIPADALSPGL